MFIKKAGLSKLKTAHDGELEAFIVRLELLRKDSQKIVFHFLEDF